MYSKTKTLEKCTGAMLCSAIGDALGWPYENRSNSINKQQNDTDGFKKWTRRTGGRYWSHYEDILPGEYSDDTQMILSVSRSLISGDWEYFFSRKELPFWLEYERGGGTALKRAAKSLKAGMLPWESDYYKQYFNAGGNGAVMRILPHVVVNSKEPNTEELIKNVIIDSIYTHGHPRAILGATCYAYVLEQLLFLEHTLTYGNLVNVALDGFEIWSKFDESIFPITWIEKTKNIDFNYSETWKNVANRMKSQLQFIQTTLKKGILINDNNVLKQLECFDNSNGAGDVAILTALYFSSKYANNPTLAIKTAAFYEGIDTDTIASITGGIIGCLFGEDWIPVEWRSIQDYNYLCEIVNILLSDNMIESSKQKKESIVDNNKKWVSTPIGKMCEISNIEIKSNNNTRIISVKFLTSLGQTIYIKKFSRIYNNKLIATTNNSNSDLSFVIDKRKIETIRNNVSFNRLTVKKMIAIIDMIIKGGYTDEYIAKKIKVSIDIVEYFRENTN